MAVEKSYARLGLFLVVALVVVLATALLFIQRLRSRAVIEMVTYTTDNVSGLDVSSPVRYRGVPVGRVAELRVDPRRHRTIEIDFEVFLDRLTTVGANVEQIQPHGRHRRHVPQASRASRVATRSPERRTCCSIAPGIPRRRSRSASHRIGRTCRRCPRRFRRCRIGCPSSWNAPKRRCRRSGRSSPECPTASTGATGSSPTSSASSRRASCPR